MRGFCGTGEECRELQNRGAAVTGIDISAASITYAAEHVPGVNFKVLDMDLQDDLMALGQNKFDLIYSSLTLHYSNDLKALLKNIHVLLAPAGQLLFSVGHPLRWAAEVKQNGASKSVTMGYRQQGSRVEILGDYLATKQFTQKLSDGPEITYWMRPISAYFDLLKTFKNQFPSPKPKRLMWPFMS